MLRGLYDLLKTQIDETEPEGINQNDFFLILSKKMKDEDLKADLLEAFRFLGENNIEDDIFNSEQFMDLLMYNGYKYTEDQAEQLLKKGDPKLRGNFNFQKFVDDMTKKKGGKKKKRRKKKKK